MTERTETAPQSRETTQPAALNSRAADIGLVVSGLEVAYGQIEVLHGVSISVPRGDMLTILGPNGAGKTTLMRTIAGLVPARSGQIRLHGEDITRVPAHRRVGRGLSLVPEGRGMLPSLTVMENLLLGTYCRAAADRRVSLTADLEQVFTLFPRLRGREIQASGSLSGGEMQMLAIARALMAKPKVLMLDEPTLGLAPVLAQQVIESLGALRKLGITVIVVEQKSPGLPAMSDQVFLMRQGRLEGAVSHDVNARELIAAYFGGRG